MYTSKFNSQLLNPHFLGRKSGYCQTTTKAQTPADIVEKIPSVKKSITMQKIKAKKILGTKLLMRSRHPI